MSLSCSCDDGDGDWWYFPPEDYTHLDTKRWRKCCSCKSLIRPGDLCAKFQREARLDEWSIKWRIYGDEMPLPTWYMCEACADQFFNLTELGFCINLPDNMMQLVREYAEMNK